MQKMKAKPFLKWAGGKTKLIPDIELRYPQKLLDDEIETYIEPFIGGGALFVDIASKYNFSQIVINDVNKELILTYRIIQKSVDELINRLEELQNIYNNLENLDIKQEFYLDIRKLFNEGKEVINYEKLDEKAVEHAANMIFLNKCCFNGLYRENKKGGFNVPFGKRENINLFEKDNLYAIHKLLQKAIILNGDFELVSEYVDENTFIYMDPPYRPLKGKNSFKDYSKEDFNDETQIRLHDFCRRMSENGALIMESNSNPKNADEEDLFFDELYSEFTIDRIQAARMINSKGSGRGKVSEILIKNY